MAGPGRARALFACAALAGILLPVAALAAPSLSRTSPNGHFVVTLVPPARIPLHDIHAWRVKVATPGGAPVTRALVYVNGGMPEHGHGLPTRPKVTRESAPGTYDIEGMKFTMPGKWEVLVAVQKLPDSDVTAFEVAIAPPVEFSSEETALIASLGLSRLPARRADPTNAHEGKPAAVSLGRRLFADPRFSANGRVSCAACHEAARQFQDGKPRGEAIGLTARRTMPLAFAGRGPWLFWDGRKDSLWSQALAPLEDAREHGINRLRVARLVKAHYLSEYRAVFGRFPDLPDAPRDAGPLGSPDEVAAWESLPPATRAAVSRVFANVGKAIAAWEATLRHEPSRFDRFAEALARGEPRAASLLDEAEANGLKVFLGKGRCVTCHNGPLFTDHFFHSTRVPPLDAANPDMGRAAGAKAVLADEFNCAGPYSDAKRGACRELEYINAIDPVLRRAFKTPSLRGVAERAPYMHAGQLATLEAVIDHYARAPESTPVTTARGHGHGSGSELQPVGFTDEERRDLVRFLATLSSPVGERSVRRR